MEEIFINLIHDYSYIIIFIWCMLEGEMALIMAGILSHTGVIVLPLAIFVAALGGFAGDQLYFYIGRYNKSKISKKLKSQRRKFAIAHLLMKKYGSWIIFIQRYLYGLRTILPISIGITRYSAKKFALINFISALAWASITILPSYILGDKIIKVLEHSKNHWYIAIPLVIIFLLILVFAFKKFEDNILNKRHEIKKRKRNEI
ncbi:DedA family protein [Campylobacter pinnipediorum]|uniref:DedA family protein n=1 Tax=Campylobacter pinnipediorum TaxID=1965231 RepID=UPI00084DA635|nr:DedA family protein [Campylobacter pinnipediorum]AQW84890.1 putative membrane protein, DedA family, type I (SNARE domain) [Campylobacter pinnipediorum subsp. pinnipediorum]OPA79746.1 hypothetical protein BFG05_01170 [Campylobacter pinnipediorum subsp. pinnipediorum]